MNGFLERTLEVDLSRRYRDLSIASVRQFKEEAVILNDTASVTFLIKKDDVAFLGYKEEAVILNDEASVIFLIKKDDVAFLGYVDGIREMQLIPLDDSVVSALITAYGKR